MKAHLHGHKYSYIVTGVVLLSLVILGIIYLVLGSDKPVDETSETQRTENQVLDTVLIEDFFLELLEPTALDIVVRDSQITIKGYTRIDAMITVNEYVVEPDIEGLFQQTITLKPGLNIIEVIASVSSGEQKSLVIGAGYIPD